MDQDTETYGILRVLKRGYKFIVFLTLLAVSTGAWVSIFLITPVYEARTDLLVNQSSNRSIDNLSFTEIETNLRLIETYQFIIGSERILDLVGEKLEGEYNTKDLKKNLRVKTSENSQIITIFVENSDPKVAVTMVNTIAETFQSEVEKLMNMDNVNILTEAKVEENPVPTKPNVVLNSCIAFLMGLTISATVVLMKEFLNTKLNTKQNVERFLSLPVLGEISLMKQSKKRGQTLDERYSKIIPWEEDDPVTTEAYRSLRTNIQFKNVDKELHTLLFTSTVSGEGKTITSGNLAVIMGMDNKNVVFVDADLRKPSGHLLFGQHKREGVTSYLSGHSKVEDIWSDTKQPNLKVIGTGPIPPNPAELLSSKQMDQLLVELKEHFDIVIIDSPPLIVSDAAILATKVDGCMFVINAQKTKRDLAIEGLEKLQQVNANILGAVLNKKNIGKQEQYYY